MDYQALTAAELALIEDGLIAAAIQAGVIDPATGLPRELEDIEDAVRTAMNAERSRSAMPILVGLNRTPKMTMSAPDLWADHPGAP